MDALISQIYSWNETLHVLDSSSVHHQEFFTVHTAMVYSFADSLQAETPDDGQRNCPKHVEFHSKNKFEKLVHPFGFIIQIYHDAWSHERQKCSIKFYLRHPVVFCNITDQYVIAINATIYKYCY